MVKNKKMTRCEKAVCLDGSSKARVADKSHRVYGNHSTVIVTPLLKQQEKASKKKSMPEQM
jgi:hypothetical protein